MTAWVETGINLTGISHATVKNCIVRQFEYGFLLTGSSGNILSGNTASDSENGFYLSSSSYNTLSGNTAVNNPGDGFLLSGSSSNTLTGNTANNNGLQYQGNGFDLVSSSSNNTLSGNTANGNYDNAGFLLASSDNTLSGNTANGNCLGFVVSSGNTLTGNTANNNSNGGFYLSSSSDNTLTANTANSSSKADGFYLYNSVDNTLTGNVAYNNAQYGYTDNSAGSGTGGTANFYSGDRCGDNGLGNSVPSGLCQYAFISLSPSLGYVGASVAITGANFLPSHGLTITYHGSATGMPTSCSTNSTGGINSGCTFTAPPSISGSYAVMVSDGTNDPKATFTVLAPSISLSPSSGAVGTTGIEISGTGFVDSQAVTAAFSGTPLALGGTCITSSTGLLGGCTFTVPLSASGPHTVEVTDGINNGEATFTVTTSISLSSSSGVSGTYASITGSAFHASSILAVTYDGSSAGMPACSSSASWSINPGCTFIVPSSASGPHTVMVTDGTNSATAMFTVTTTNTTLGPTTTSVVCVKASVTVGTATACKATVYGSAPTGRVTWSSNSSGKFSSATCRLSRRGPYSTCLVRFKPTVVGSSVMLIANYDGDSKNSASVGAYDLTVAMRTTKTTLSCSPKSVVAGSSTIITCKARVKGYLPTGTVSWSQGGVGSVTLSSTTCTLKKYGPTLAQATCSVKMTGTTAGTVTMQATYGGDSNNLGSHKTAKLTIKP